MLSKRLIAMASALLLGGLGCPDDPDLPPGSLEIGVRGDDGSFEVLSEGDSVAVELGANGLNMIVPSLRAAGINPTGPDPTILIEVGDILMAADIEGSRVNMDADGESYVLWDLRVPFQTALCCYVCRDGLIRAELVDHTGRSFLGEVTVQLERGGCPDPDACCGEAGACPDPTTTLVCE